MSIIYSFYPIVDTMIDIIMKTPQEMQEHIARQLRTKRLELNLSQQTLSKKSGVSYAVLKKFEHTGQISLKSLLKLALVLGCMNAFDALFAATKPETALSLDDLIKDDIRKRGRK